MNWAVGFGMKLMNTCFPKNINNHLVTYKSGHAETVVDYILVHCDHQSRVNNAKVIPGEEVVSQHCLLVTDIVLKKVVKHKKKFESKVCLRKLERQCCESF